MAELIVMPYRQLEPPFVGQCNKSLGLLLMECKWLLHIDVTSALQANPRDIEMAFRRRRDMDNVRSGVTQEFSQVGEVPFYRESLVQLPCHWRLAVTAPDDLASLDPLDLRRVSIGDLAASHDGDFKHPVLSPGSFGNNASIPPLSAPLASSPAAPSIFRWYNASASSRRAISSD